MISLILFKPVRLLFNQLEKSRATLAQWIWNSPIDAPIFLGPTAPDKLLNFPLLEKRKLPIPPRLEIHARNLKELTTELKKQEVIAFRNAEKIMQDAIDIAHRYTDQLKLEALGSLIKPLDRHELQSAVTNHDDSLILRSNPSLSQKDLFKITALITNHQYVSNQHARIKKVLTMLDTHQKNNYKDPMLRIFESFWGDSPRREQLEREENLLLRQSMLILDDD